MRLHIFTSLLLIIVLSASSGFFFFAQIDANQDACAYLPPIPSVIPTGTVKIVGILPNPQGKDSNQEWIEIVNSADDTINLQYYILRINNTAYRLPDSKLSSGDRIKLFTESLKIPLPNTAGEIYLETITGNISDQLNYERPQQGKIYTH